jgi:hypothetical protein
LISLFEITTFPSTARISRFLCFLGRSSVTSVKEYPVQFPFRVFGVFRGHPSFSLGFIP